MALYFKLHKHIPIKVRRPLALEIAAFFAHLMALVLPLVMVQIFDRVIPNEGRATLAVLLAVLLAAALGEAVLRAASAAVAARSAARFEIDAIDRIAYLALYERRPASAPHDPVETLAHFDTIERVRALAASDSRQSRFTLPFAVVFGSAFALIAPSLTWVLILSLLAVVLTQAGARRSDAVNAERTERSKRSSAFIIEAFESLETIKGMHAEPFLARRHEALALGAAFAREKAALARGARRALTETTASAVPVTMAVAGAYSVVNNQLTAGALAAAILLSGRVIQPLMRAQAAHEARSALRPAERSLAARLSQPLPKPASAVPEALKTLKTSELTVRSAEGRVLLDRISLEISAGETIAITGSSGSGKSLLLRSLTGRLPADEGAVLWNGKNVGTYDPQALGCRMQLLLQNARLPDATALEFMTAGDPARASDVLAICSALGIERAFAEHPQGMNTRLGRTSAQHLPATILRRLHIVRTLSFRPDVILFDEANGGLDAEADSRLREYLFKRKGEFALVLVTARPSYIRLADRVFTMEDGMLCAASHDAMPLTGERRA